MISLIFASFLARWVLAAPSTAPCSDALPKPVVGGATITSLTAAVVHNYAVNITGESNNWPGKNITGLSFCQVNVSLTHPGIGDLVHNQVWLPMTGWNGMFLGVGGGGYVAGSWSSLAPAVERGYAAVSTDAGHDQNDTGDATSWALFTGGVNKNLLLDFASRSVHDMTVLGKAVTTSFYGTAPKFAYWQGCSTGGRQGMMEAQMYPGDYDGIVAAAPAINWNDFTPAQQWPFTVMNNEGYAPPQCEFDAVTAAAIAACDHLDGLKDGIIAAPGLCKFDPSTLVGKNYTCHTDGTNRRFSPKIATVVQKIWQGPVNGKGAALWYGITPGTNFSSLAPTETFANNDTTIPLPFSISDSWFRDFIFKSPSYNTSSIPYSQFPSLITQSKAQYDTVMGTNNAHLASFKAAGAKMITWQGLADNLIMPNGTMNYFDRVQRLDKDVADYFRVFFAPGVGHCGGGSGPIPNDVLMALRAWVENGTAPNVLPASSAYAINGTIRHQNLCPYPLVSKYDGKGDPAKAASFSCEASF